MIVLGFDTATPATVVGLRLTDGSTLQARHDPVTGERPGHATRLLCLADELLRRARLDWSALQRIAVGLGPGRFTGLRVGVATARGLAQSLSVELVGVSTLRALAEVVIAREPGRVEGTLAVLDARRDEVFAAAYSPEGELGPPRVLAPAEVASVLADAGGLERSSRWLAVGAGAVRFRGYLEAVGVVVPADSSPLHRVSAEAICDLALHAPAVACEAIVPDYLRRPDAEIALENAYT